MCLEAETLHIARLMTSTKLKMHRRLAVLLLLHIFLCRILLQQVSQRSGLSPKNEGAWTASKCLHIIKVPAQHQNACQTPHHFNKSPSNANLTVLTLVESNVFLLCFPPNHSCGYHCGGAFVDDILIRVFSLIFLFDGRQIRFSLFS